MPRPERALDAQAGPIQAFAANLRQVREKAGSPTYLKMARATGRSRTALAEAAGGDHLPTWETVEAYLTDCGQMPGEWRNRWETVRTELDQAVKPPVANSVPDRIPALDANTPPAEPARPRFHWRWPALGVFVLGLSAVATLLAFASPPDHDGAKPPPARLAQPNVPRSGPVTVIVQNKVAIGAHGLVEDTTPDYLSTRTVPRCAENGCEVPGTQMWSGAVLQVLCQVQGATMTNESLASAGITDNPGGVTSALWYEAEMPTGVAGFIPEVYLTPASRGGLGLRQCPPVLS